MDVCGRNNATFLLLLVILSPDHIFPLVNGNGSELGNNPIQDTKSSIAKTVTDTLSTLKKSHKTSWEKIKVIIRHVQLQFFTPNLDFRGTGEANGKRGNEEDGGPSQKMKKAAGKSFKTTCETAGKTAESAAIAVEKVAHTTTQTVKRKLSTNHDDNKKCHDEL